MKPKTLSATALQVASLCLARYQVEHLSRIPGRQNRAASLGSAVHRALELFVQMVCIEGKAGWDKKLIQDLYAISYSEVFNSSDHTTPEFEDGLQLVLRWFDNTDLRDVPKVLSVEVKENFSVPTAIGPIPFNYIWDRFDYLGDDVYRVVDYKSSKWNITATDLNDKIQPHAYALAARIKHPEAERIWVQFDMLRYDRVGRVFTREDSTKFWMFLKREAQRIIDTPDSNVPETLNPECRFCPRKLVCTALTKNVALGGTHGLEPDEAVRMKLQIESQLKALESLSSEIDEVILTEAERRDEIEWDTEHGHVNITASKRRKANSNAVANIVGPALTTKYGNFTLKNIDEMKKSGELSPEQIQQIDNHISLSYGDPTPKVKPPSPLEK